MDWSSDVCSSDLGDPGVAADPICLQPLQQEALAVGMLQAQPADRRLVEAGQAVEHRGLAGTVGADDGGDLAVPGREADVIDRDPAAEPDGQVLDREQRPNANSAASTAGALRSRGYSSTAGDGV